MPLPHFVTDSEKKWLFKVTEHGSPWPERDLCILAFFLGTPCRIMELNIVRLTDVYSLMGKTPRKFKLLDTDSHEEPRYCYLTSKNLRVYLSNYIDTLCVKG